MKIIFFTLLIFYSMCYASTDVDIEKNFNKFVANTLSLQPNQDEKSVIQLFGKPDQANSNHGINIFNKKTDNIYNYPSPKATIYHYISIAIHKKKVTAFQMCYTFMAAPGAFSEKCMSVKEFWRKYKADEL